MDNWEDSLHHFRIRGIEVEFHRDILSLIADCTWEWYHQGIEFELVLVEI